MTREGPRRPWARTAVGRRRTGTRTRRRRRRSFCVVPPAAAAGEAGREGRPAASAMVTDTPGAPKGRSSCR